LCEHIGNIFKMMNQLITIEFSLFPPVNIRKSEISVCFHRCVWYGHICGVKPFNKHARWDSSLKTRG